MTVIIGDDPDGTNSTICGSRMNMNTEVARFVCHQPQVSRYVHIRIPGPQYLHLCEVKVLGERREYTFTGILYNLDGLKSKF